jgi:hypothetical protein
MQFRSFGIFKPEDPRPNAPSRPPGCRVSWAAAEARNPRSAGERVEQESRSEAGIDRSRASVRHDARSASVTAAPWAAQPPRRLGLPGVGFQLEDVKFEIRNPKSEIRNLREQE